MERPLTPQASKLNTFDPLDTADGLISHRHENVLPFGSRMQTERQAVLAGRARGGESGPNAVFLWMKKS